MNEGGGSFGNIAFVESRKNGFKMTFTGASVEYRLATGALFPILAAFRWMVEERKGQFVWRGGFEAVLRMWKRGALEMLQMTKQASDELGPNPNAIGKSRNHWAKLVARIAMRDFDDAALPRPRPPLFQFGDCVARLTQARTSVVEWVEIRKRRPSLMLTKSSIVGGGGTSRTRSVRYAAWFGIAPRARRVRCVSESMRFANEVAYRPSASKCDRLDDSSPVGRAPVLRSQLGISENSESIPSLLRRILKSIRP